MKSLGEYTLADWRRMRPVVHAYKTQVYRAIDAWYVRRRAPGLSGFVERIRGENKPTLALTIAYEAPWVVEEQIAAAAGLLPGTTLAVCDNSRSDAAAGEIEQACARGGIAYLRLPRNPRKTGSRSHALAMNWAYRNVVCAVGPASFAFLDHDLIPLREVDLAGLVRRQPFYGGMHRAGHRWFLWAGYCVFDGRFADRPVLDFSQDWFAGLDTGGANYRRIYRRYECERLAFAHRWVDELVDPADGGRVQIEYCDDWLHLGSVSGWDPDVVREPAVMRRIIAVARAGQR